MLLEDLEGVRSLGQDWGQCEGRHGLPWGQGDMDHPEGVKCQGTWVGPCVLYWSLKLNLNQENVLEMQEGAVLGWEEGMK